MKRILIALILFSSCQNQKAKIVELQKQAKDSTAFYQWQMDSLETLMRQHNADITIDMNYRHSFGKMHSFKEQYDSLEIELKKQ